MSRARGAGPYLANLRSLIRGRKSRTAPANRQATVVVDNPRNTGWYWTCTTCQANAGKSSTSDEAHKRGAVEHPQCPTDPNGIWAWTLPGHTYAEQVAGQAAAHRLLEGAGTSGINVPMSSRVAAIREAVAYLQDSGEHFAAGLLDGWLSVRADEPDDRHSVEQGGPDPDDLRTRLAVALLARIKLATVSGPQPFGHDALTSLFAATEYDLADTALAALRSELDELADYRNRITWETTCGEHARLLDACRAADEARELAEAKVSRVREWIAGEPVTGVSEFGNGYREALRDITDALDGPNPTADREAQADLAALPEGEEPYEDEAAMPTPGQWIWKWNRATPEERYAVARRVMAMGDALEQVRHVRLRGAWLLSDPAGRRFLEDLTAALDGNPAPATRIVQASTEQPVSDPQPVDESAPDTCHVVYVDGGPIRIHGHADMTPETTGYFAEVVRAAKRKYAAEHPDSELDSALSPNDGTAICACTPQGKCPSCVAAGGDG